jgi:hypothetical protein
MSAINVTFVNYSSADSQFRALEHCGKCKDFQVTGAVILLPLVLKRTASVGVVHETLTG